MHNHVLQIIPRIIKSHEYKSIAIVRHWRRWMDGDDDDTDSATFYTRTWTGPINTMLAIMAEFIIVFVSAYSYIGLYVLPKSSFRTFDPNVYESWEWKELLRTLPSRTTKALKIVFTPRPNPNPLHIAKCFVRKLPTTVQSYVIPINYIRLILPSSLFPI